MTTFRMQLHSMPLSLNPWLNPLAHAQMDGGGAYGAAAGGGGGGEAGEAGGGFEFGVDPTMDPELVMALRVSMQEERARQEAAAAAAAGAEGGAAPAAAAAGDAAEAGAPHDFWKGGCTWCRRWLIDASPPAVLVPC